MGTPPAARAFRDATGWRGPLYVDPDAVAYEAAGLVRASPAKFLRPRVALAVLRARKRGFRQGKTVGDPLRLGGTLLVAPGDVLAWSWRNASAEDDAPVEDVAAAARAWREQQEEAARDR
jgi:hypothetical protein